MEKILFLKGKFVSKIWGGEELKKEFSYDINKKDIGEYWAISAMDGFSSEVLNGEYKGEELDDLYKNHRELFGNEGEKTFPLLIKLIDAKDDLSIQVHPDDEMAKKVENSRGKTECWYILNKSEASIIYGLKTNSKIEALDMIDQGKWKDLLKETPTHKDDFFYVPAGTVHAIKKGSLILEIQQASDITYRLYDYDRLDKNGNKRELNLEKSKEAIKINKVFEKTKIEKIGNNKKRDLLKNEYFQVTSYEVVDEISLKRESPYLLESVIEGSGFVEIEGKKHPIKKGDFFILTNGVSNYKFIGNFKVVESNIVK